MRSLKNKKKVLVLASTFPRWVNDTNPPFVFDLCLGLAKTMDITVLTPHYPGAKDDEIMSGLKVHRFHYFFSKWEKLAGNGGILPVLKSNKLNYLLVPLFLLAEIIATIKLVNKLKPDTIHAHWIIPQGLAAYINFLINKTPYTVTSHGSDLHTLGLVPLKRVILQKAQTITVVSNEMKNIVGAIDKNLLKKTNIMPMKVDKQLFNPSKYDESIKTQYGITGPFLLFVGRLAPEKGINYLIDAMPKVIAEHPTTKLLIIGNGTLEKELMSQVAKLGIESNVIFLGGIPHHKLPPYFATADIFISPSIKEGYGLTMAEAIASGCQVIATNISVIGDIVRKEDLIRSASTSAISKRVIDLL